MRKILLICILIFAAFGAPSCYDISKIEKFGDMKSERAVFILIDETTPFNEQLKQQIINNALNFANHGNHIFIAKFSAFLQGKYNEVLFDFVIDTPLADDQRYNLSKNVIAKFDKCLKDQLGYVRKNITDTIKDSFLKDGDKVAKSDILYALKDFAQNIIGPNETQNKVVIMASDMLENSSITSFYAQGKPRKIDSKKEIDIVKKNNLLTDFGGAKVYVIGAGLSDSKKAYINSQMLGSLNDFWSEYFRSSNANLIEMGTPALKREIR